MRPWHALPRVSTPEPVRPAAPAYERDAGTTAIVAGISGIVYSVAFLGGVVAGWAPQLSASEPT